MNGGYIMIDATGLDVSVTTEQTVTGIYDQIADAAESGKMIMMTGADNNGTLISPFVVQCEAGSNSYTLKNGVYVFAVASDDGVTVSAAGSGSDVVSFPGFPNFSDEIIGRAGWEDDTYITMEQDAFVYGFIMGADSGDTASLTVSYGGEPERTVVLAQTPNLREDVWFYIKAGMKIKIKDVYYNNVKVCGLFH